MFYSENATKTLHSRTWISKHKNVPKYNLFTMNLFCSSLSVNSLPDSIFLTVLSFFIHEDVFKFGMVILWGIKIHFQMMIS